jgi:hypothetical protein
MQRYRLVCFAALALVACNRDRGNADAAEARQLAGRALSGALAYPGSAVVSVAAGTDAAEMQFASTAPIDEVARWFREALPLNGWELKNEGKGKDGSASIYAEKAGRPLWITLRPNVGAPGTSYTLIGAIVDSTTSDSASAARDRPRKPGR